MSIVNFYIVHELDTWLRDLNPDFTLGHCFSDPLSLLKLLAKINFRCNDYGSRFDALSDGRGEYTRNYFWCRQYLVRVYWQ